MEMIYYLLLLCCGIAVGMIIKAGLDSRKKVVGIVQIDHETGLCRIAVIDEKLSDTRIKKVIFTVDHNATITDENLIKE